ncbi:hypothetical protein CDAR_95941 [Caerostris darwini]|uniref:Uncharacterized protein n=1 Tax=Caerostris darwini TaxID=1538125 RepID=A0AAV4UPN5_9ARAC|nr:hypothetical protein CDAR_95941 [Caerostris darwini]
MSTRLSYWQRLEAQHHKWIHFQTHTHEDLTRSKAKQNAAFGGPLNTQEETVILVCIGFSVGAFMLSRSPVASAMIGSAVVINSYPDNVHCILLNFIDVLEVLIL